MRILQVNKFYDLRGGTERVLFDLEDGLRERGHEVAVFANRNARNRPTPWAEWFAPARDYEDPSLRQRLRYACTTVYDPEARAAFARLLDAFAPDVVHLHNIYHQLSPSLLDELRARSVPAVMTLHDYKLACPVYRLFREGRICTLCVGKGTGLRCGIHTCSRGSRAESWVLAFESTFHRRRRSWERGVDRFLCPSDFLRRVMLEQGMPGERLEVVRNAPRRVPEPAPVEARAPRPTLLYTGRLSVEKGVDVLVEAARRVPEVEVRIAGQGPQEESLRVVAQGLDRIQWLGHLDGAALERERAAAWAVAVPSVWYENAPLSVIEAQLAARPVVAAAHGGLLEMVEEETDGWLVEPGEVDAWAGALRRLAQSADALGHMGRRARERAQRVHDYEGFLDRHEEIYSGLAGVAP